MRALKEKRPPVVIPRRLVRLLTDGELKTWCVLNLRADDEGVCEDAQRVLADAVGRSVSTIRKALCGLEAHGLILIIPRYERQRRATGRRRTTNQYRLLSSTKHIGGLRESKYRRSDQ